MRLFVLLFITSIFFACNSNTKTQQEGDPQVYAEANEIHQRSLDLREEITEIEKELKTKQVDYSQEKEALKTWDKDIIEVPGHEHSHDDEHQRDYHVHNPMKDFSDVQHLEYQRVMHNEIMEIHSAMKRKTVPDIMH